MCAIRAFNNPSFSTDFNKIKLVYIVINRNSAEPIFTHYTCTVGLRKECSHVGAVLFAICDIVAEGIKELPADPTYTELNANGQDPKAQNVSPKLWRTFNNLHNPRLGSEPPPKAVKPSASLDDKVFKFPISEDKDIERKMKLKNDILAGKKRDDLPPVFHLIGTSRQKCRQGPGVISHCMAGKDSSQVNDIELPYCMEVEVQTSDYTGPRKTLDYCQPLLKTCLMTILLLLLNVTQFPCST